MHHPYPTRLLLCALLPCTTLGSSETSAPRSAPPPDFPELQFLATATLQAPAAAPYKPGQRDPFVDPSVKQTLHSEPQQAPEPPPEDKQALDTLVPELEACLAQSEKIQGIICAPEGSMALIGKRIIKPGDYLEIPLSELLAAQLKDINLSEHLGLDNAIDKNLLPLQVVRITPSGVTFQQVESSIALELPFSRHTSDPAAAEPAHTPK